MNQVEKRKTLHANRRGIFFKLPYANSLKKTGLNVQRRFFGKKMPEP